MAKKQLSAAEKMEAAHQKRLQEFKKQSNISAMAQKKRLELAALKAEEEKERALKKAEEEKQATKAIKEEITNYLESEQQFDEGYDLLSQYSSNVCLLAQVLRKKLHSKVIYELKKLLDKEVIKPVRSGIITKPQKKVIVIGNAYKALRSDESAPTMETELTEEQRKEALADFLKGSGSGIDPNSLPEELKVYYDNACKYYHIFRHWHEVMKLAKTDMERSAAMAKAKPAEEFKAKCWNVIDTWVKDGTLPEQTNKTEANTAETPAEIASEIMRAKSYITKALKTLELKQGEKYEEQKGKLAERVNLLKKHNQVPKVHEEMLLKHGLITKD